MTTKFLSYSSIGVVLLSISLVVPAHADSIRSNGSAMRSEASRSGLSTDTELRMIEVQSMMSQRQRTIATTQALGSALGGPCKICQNIR